MRPVLPHSLKHRHDPSFSRGTLSIRLRPPATRSDPLVSCASVSTAPSLLASVRSWNEDPRSGDAIVGGDVRVSISAVRSLYSCELVGTGALLALVDANHLSLLVSRSGIGVSFNSAHTRVDSCPCPKCTYIPISAHHSLFTTSAFACDGSTPSLLTTTAHSCCGEHQTDLTRFTGDPD